MADQNDLQKPDGTSNYNTETWQTLRAHVARIWLGDYTGMGNLVAGMRRWVTNGAGNVKLQQRNAGGTEDTLFDSTTKADVLTVNTALASKVDNSALTTALASKVDNTTLATALTGKADVGVNATITELTALTALNSGPISGFRNRIINGGMVIANYGGIKALTTTPQIGMADRHLVWSAGFGSVSGSIIRGTRAGTAYGYMHGAAGVTTTGSGNIFIAQRIASENISDRSGKYVTASVTVYQDTGSPINVVLGYTAPTAKDNYASTTAVSASAAMSVPSGVATRLSYTYQLPANAADNGLMPYVQFSAGAVSNKNFNISDWQVEPGAAASLFDVHRSPAMEGFLCAQYARTVPITAWPGVAYAANSAYLFSSGPQMRGTPTLSSLVGGQLGFGGSSAAITGSSLAVANANGDIAVQVQVGSGLVAGQAVFLSFPPTNAMLTAEIN